MCKFYFAYLFGVAWTEQPRGKEQSAIDANAADRLHHTDAIIPDYF